jgi:hypothetical protein
MYNYYLYNSSYEHASSSSLEESLKCLNDLAVENRDDFDSFLKHHSLWNVNVEDGLLGEVIFSNLSDQHFARIVLPRLLQRIKDVDNEITSLEDFDKDYNLYNAFYGVSFTKIIPKERCITNKEEYAEFRNRNLCDITPATLWERKELLFKKIILCGEVKDNLHDIGGTYLKQIFKQLIELDEYISKYWTKNRFNYRDVCLKTSLTISPESSRTMKNEHLKKERMFSLPDGRVECFELHIKTGNLRFHFYPEDTIIYIGYIGKHLRIS